MIGRIFKFLAVLLGLTALWLFVVAMHWLPPLSEAERERLALMRDDRASRDSRGWAAAWLTGYEVPEAQRASWLANPPGDLPEQLAAFPERRAPQSLVTLCGTGRDDCLGAVAADAQVVREALAGAEEFVAAVTALELHEAVHDPQPGQMRDAMSLWGGAGALVRAQAALAFHDGNGAAAAERLCRSATWWRELRSGASSLVISLAPVTQLADHGRLLAAMLAADPQLALPATCDQAFAAPTADELDLCEAVRGEFRRMEAWHREPPVPPEGWEKTAFGLVNLEHTLALSTESFAHYCEAPARADLLAGRVPTNPPDPAQCGFGGWVFNPLGCMLAPLAGAFYDSFALRVIDYARRQKLVASAIWLHRQAADDAEAAFSARPEALRDPAARFGPADESGPARLEVELLDPRRDPVYALPLAPGPLPHNGAEPDEAAPE